jgi:hypothetical protein
MMRPTNINPVQWSQAIGLARLSCARIFRDGGAPADAMKAHGLRIDSEALDWDKAIEAIAGVLCAAARPVAAKRAASAAKADAAVTSALRVRDVVMRSRSGAFIH